jgi:hypothetical protein
MDIRIKEAVMGSQVISNDPIFSPSLITFFNVNPAEVTREEKEKLAEIDKMLDGKDDVAKIQHLRSLRMRLATPSIGQSDIDSLHKYLKLNNAVRENMAQAESMEVKSDFPSSDIR